jgi:hypothetical protein
MKKIAVGFFIDIPFIKLKISSIQKKKKSPNFFPEFLHQVAFPPAVD